MKRGTVDHIIWSKVETSQWYDNNFFLSRQLGRMVAGAEDPIVLAISIAVRNSVNSHVYN